MLFEFTRSKPNGYEEKYILSDVVVNNGCVSATCLSSRQVEVCGNTYYLKEQPREFFAAGSFTLLEYKEELKDPSSYSSGTEMADFGK